MHCPPPVPVLRLLIPALAAGLALRAEPPGLDSLVTNSPFAAAPGSQGKKEEAHPLEFRGVLREGPDTFFSVYEAATKKSFWVELNEPGFTFTLRSHDEAAGTLQVDYQGRTMTLPLARAPKTAAMPGVGGVPLAPPAANPGPGVAAPPTGPNPQLATQIAEEIRRRRALRQQSADTPPPAKPPPPAKR